MKLKLIATLAVTSLGALSFLALPSSAAAPKAGDKPAAGAPKNIPMPVYPGLKFGMSLEQIAKLNDKFHLDTEYKKKITGGEPVAVAPGRRRSARQEAGHFAAVGSSFSTRRPASINRRSRANTATAIKRAWRA